MITNKEIAERLRNIADDVEQDETCIQFISIERSGGFMSNSKEDVNARIVSDHGSIKIKFQILRG